MPETNRNQSVALTFDCNPLQWIFRSDINAHLHKPSGHDFGYLDASCARVFSGSYSHGPSIFDFWVCAYFFTRSLENTRNSADWLDLAKFDYCCGHWAAVHGLDLSQASSSASCTDCAPASLASQHISRQTGRTFSLQQSHCVIVDSVDQENATTYEDTCWLIRLKMMDRKLHRCNPCYFCAYVTSWKAWEKRSRWRLPSHRKNVEPSRNYTTLCCPSSSQCPSDPCKTMSRSDLIYRIYSAGQELQRVKAIPPCFFSASTRLHHYGSWFQESHVFA